MKRVKIFDTTLRDGEQSPGCSMNLQEKLEMAKQLDKLGVDVIEAGFAIASIDDFNAVQSIAKTCTNATVASLARATKGDIDRAWEAVKEAKKPRIHVFLATSDLHMEYKLKMSREQVLAKISEMVALAKSYCEDIQFSAEDASRSDKEFLVKAYEAAINAGATTLNVPDTVGYATPEEMSDLITYLKTNVKGIDNVDIAVHCHDDLGLAVANTLASIHAGATQAECTINGIGERAGNASLEEIVMNISTRSDYYNESCNIDTKQIYRTAKMLSAITGVPIAPNKSIIGANAFAHESGIHQHGMLAKKETYEIMSPCTIGIPENKMVLGKHSGKHAFKDRLISLGYDLNDNEIEKAFIDFKSLADKKKVVNDKDIEALLSISNKLEVQEVYSLVGFVVNSGSVISATATVKLAMGEEEIEMVAKGSGPIDAAFQAINMITNTKATLDNYAINSVSEGEDALGDVTVNVHYNDQKITGRGMSTDIIEASINAYLNAINKICTSLID
ncbi:MAG: 2-isopropylmalate synthase [Erysipelotrichaceae bacterium]